jgi:hypothetical protein
MNNDDLIERLGQAQQKVMSLTVAKMALQKRAEVAEARADILEELVVDVIADIRDSVPPYKIDERIAAVLQKLDGDE